MEGRAGVKVVSKGQELSTKHLQESTKYSNKDILFY